MKIILAVLVVLVLAVSSLLVFSGHTAITMPNAPTTIGVSTPVTAQLQNPHGVRHVAAYLEQNGSRVPLYEQDFPGRRIFWARHEAARTVTFEAGKTTVPSLKEGKARIVVEAVSNDLRGSMDSAARDVNVILAPPRVIPDNLQHYVNQGGMELVTFSVGGSLAESGVKNGNYEFRSFPMPGSTPDQRFSMFGFPWDLRSDTVPVVFARNEAGTEVTGHFGVKVFPKKFRERDFDLSDELLAKLVTSVDPTGQLAPGPDMLSRFLKINGDLRKKNNEQLAALRFKTEEKMLWNGPFLHFGKEEADFADVRNYVYHGKKVDQQVHLGFDLSDVQNGPVSAANDGRVVWASDLGIYGNCIVLDHGYSLQSIYGHLRQIDVKVGDMVRKGQKMGIAGQTGLAGGVHVHFSMQIDGVQTNPREWWDEHWIKDRILSKLAPELTPQNTASAAPPAQSTARRKSKRRK